MQTYQTRYPLCVVVGTDHQVEYVGFGPPPPDHLPAGEKVIISGDMAVLLYVALTGHAYEDHPDSANINEASVAREEITALNDEEARTAQAVVRTWGDHIQPWLFVTKLDDDGRPILDHLDYTKRISLEPAATPV